MKTEEDLNAFFIRHKHRKHLAKRFVYSRIALMFLLILLQIVIFYFFLVELNKNFEIYLGGSLILSFGFMIFLSNSSGKNEFKLAWILPLIIFPLFGIAAYVLYHTNLGGAKMKKNLKSVKQLTEKVQSPSRSPEAVLQEFPDAAGLGDYLYHTGSFFPHSQNQLSYYKNGEDVRQKFLEDIASAKDFIFLEFFIIDIDETWTSLLELLKEKVRQGVEVRIIYDALGSMLISSRRYKKYLENLGIKALVFSPIIPFFSTRMNNRDHRKILVVDGKISYTGGLNIANEYVNYGKNRFDYWKDNAIRIQGSATANLTSLFLQTWNIYTDQKDDYQRFINAPAGQFDQKGLVIPYGDDAYNQHDIAENVYYYIAENSKRYLHITSPYVILDNHMLESLTFAARRGVEVSLIVPSRPDHYITFCVGKIFLKSLMDAGAKIYTYNKGFIHAKTFICDDSYATVGSVNLDYRSFFYHFECGTLIYGSPVINSIEEDFQETLRDCTLMTPESYKKIPKIQRAIGRIFRIFAPLI